MGNYVLCYLRCYKELADSNPFLWVRIKLNYQYKKGFHKGSLFCIGDPNEIVNSHGSRRGPLSRRKARASFNRAPQLPAPNSTRSNLSGLFTNTKKPPQGRFFRIGDPNEIRTRIATVKGWCPNH